MRGPDYVEWHAPFGAVANEKIEQKKPVWIYETDVPEVEPTALVKNEAHHVFDPLDS